MSLRTIIGSVLLTLIASNLLGQQGEVYVIDKIRFEGVQRSNVDYLLEQIQTNITTQYTDSLIRIDVQRLKNLSSIGNASYRIENNGNLSELIFEIDEIKTLLPILNLGRIKDNLWFQGGIVDINWRGRGQVLSAAYLYNDNRHSANIYYKNPRLSNSNWGYSASLSSWSSIEPLFFEEGTVNYEYGNDAIGLTFIRHLGYNRYFELGSTFFIENYERSEIQISELMVGPDRLRQPKILNKVKYAESFLNYDLFYLKGIAWSAQYQNVLNTVDNTWFHILQLESTSYLRMGQRGNFANRIQFGISTNNNSPFAPFVADSHINIRGIGNRIDRGTAQIFINSEYRHAFMEYRKLGVQGVVFTDMGTWRNPGGQLKDLFDPSGVRLFAGAGIRLIYPKVYNAILRIDYAIDFTNTNQRGFVIGLGQYF